MKSAFVKVRRVDFPDEETDRCHELNLQPTIHNFKNTIFELLHIKDVDDKIIKIRNPDGHLVPLKVMLEDSSPEKPYLIEITTVHHDIDTGNSPVYSVQVEAITNKLHDMESRVLRAEKVLPQLKWKRQSILEFTTNNLGSRIAFLDRRVDELMPPEWHEHIQNSVNFPY